MTALRVPNPFLALPRRARPWVLPLSVIGIWWALFHFQWSGARALASLADVAHTAGVQLASTDFWWALGASVGRFLVGWVLGCVLGTLVGAATGFSRLLDGLIGPSFHALKQVSLFAWIPLISVWFGLGDVGKIAFLGLAAFFPVVLNVHEGIRGVPAELVEVARSFCFTRTQLVCKVVVPAAAPALFTGVQLALINAWLGGLGAEYLLVAGSGIGNLLVDGREHFQMDLVLFGVLVIGAVGATFTWIATRIEARVLAWRGNSFGKL